MATQINKPTTRSQTKGQVQAQAETKQVQTKSTPNTISVGVGLVNLGNTCFMNCMLQVLAQTPEFTSQITPDVFRKRCEIMMAKNGNSNQIPKPTPIKPVKQVDCVLLDKWFELYSQLSEPQPPRKANVNAATTIQRKNKVINPLNFYKAFQQNIKTKEINNGFVGFNANDAAEFFSMIIDSIHGALSRKVKMSILGTQKTDTDIIAVKAYETIQKIYENDYSEMLPLFFGIYISEIISQKTGKRLSFTPDPYFEIHLSLDGVEATEDEGGSTAISLIKCLDKHCAGEIIEDYMNEKTKERETIQRRIRFWSFPKIVVINLKRFDSHAKEMVDFPLILNLGAYCYQYNSQANYDYELYAVCYHMGNLHGGHYVSIIKDSASQEWQLFDDDKVSPIDSKSPNFKKLLVNQSAYCLFYRATTTTTTTTTQKMSPSSSSLANISNVVNNK